MKTKIDRLYKSTEANQHRAANPQTSAWVSASAGSGKTKVLTDRVLNLLLSGVSPQRVLCLTFTKAAAAEMAQRINSELGSWAVSNSNDLESKLGANHLDHFMVGTSLCGRHHVNRKKSKRTKHPHCENRKGI